MLPTPLRHQDGSHLCESQTPGKGFKTLACHSSVTNLAMIFKLEAQQGIYTVHSEEEAEIILPSESGTVLVEDFSKTYVVNGEPVVSVIPPQSPSTSLGIPISYQQPRSKTNPPPGNGRFERPTFKVVKSQGWKKSFMVVEITSSGHVFDKYQVHINLKEETASVPVIEEMLKEQLGFDICVLDSKYLPIMAGEKTTGKRC